MPALALIKRSELTPGAMFLAKADGTPHTIGKIRPASPGAPEYRNAAVYELLAPGRKDGHYFALFSIRRHFLRP